jgi:Transglutaminase-like superfamily
MSGSRARRRVGIVAGLVSSPRDLWLLVRMSGWALVVPVLKFLLPLPRLVRLVAPRTRRRRGTDRVLRLSGLLYGAGPFHLSDNCLERSLVTFRYLDADADPNLVVGMRGENGGYVGHAWVTVEGVPVHDPPGLIESLSPFVAFTAEGRTLPVPEARPGSR